MTPETVLARLASAFASLEKDSVQVKDALTLRLREPGQLLSVMRKLKDELGFGCLELLTAVDWGCPPRGRGAGPYRDSIELVYGLYNLDERLRVFVKLDVARRAPAAASIVSVFKSAAWLEREVSELFGVDFPGHPDPRRLLTPDFLVGHPLRKDYASAADRFD